MQIRTDGLIYCYQEQPQMQVEVILASATDTGSPPIYTIRMRYPRPIHGEIMTHRVFGRNARSSRAVPVKTMLNEVRTIPYVPWHWGKNQKGMQADAECDALVEFKSPKGMVMHSMSREIAWLSAANAAVSVAEAFMEAGYHKQNPNRLLEPFSWIDTLITATDWKNFLWLRQHGAAEPHLQDLANLVAIAITNAHVQKLSIDDWHLPYITEEDREQTRYMSVDEAWAWLCKISAARCARISYKPFNGNSSYEAELDRYNLLVKSDRVHASPLEHQAKPDEWISHLAGSSSEGDWACPELHGNLTGWIQNRKLIPNEVYLG